MARHARLPPNSGEHNEQVLKGEWGVTDERYWGVTDERYIDLLVEQAIF